MGFNQYRVPLYHHSFYCLKSAIFVFRLQDFNDVRIIMLWYLKSVTILTYRNQLNYVIFSTEQFEVEDLRSEKPGNVDMIVNEFAMLLSTFTAFRHIYARTGGGHHRMESIATGGMSKVLMLSSHAIN